MAAYAYEAIDRDGKVSRGSIVAETTDLARADLKNQGLTLLEIKDQGVLGKEINIEIGGYPKPRDMSVFCRQFVSMTKAGVSIIETLRMLEDQTECKQLKKAITGVRVSVEQGETLANSMAAFPKVFPDLLVTMVAAGEAAGCLDTAMERMSVQFEKSAKTRALVKKAMMYPIIVVIVAIAVVIVMLVVVIPTYGEMFNDLGTDLPAITKVVQKMSDFIIQRWYILVPVIIAVVVALKMFSGTNAGKHFFHLIMIKIPIFSNLTIKQASSQMARTMGTLMAAGVPLVEAVDIVGDTMNNVYFREAMQTCHDEVVIGQPFSRPLEDVGVFPPMVYHMVKIGEESGTTEQMLDKLADYYDEEVEMATQTLMAALEPMIIVVLAIIVIFLVAACMAPMLTMYTAMDSL